MKNIVFSILLSFAAVLNAFGYNKAVFPYFNYSGNDDYYNANRLTDEGDYFNPVISGWASDPSICNVGNDFWLVTSTFGYFPGIPLYHSKDLLTWKHVGNILSRKSQLNFLDGLSIDKGGLYAPSITYNPHNRMYYMITTCVMNGKDGSTMNFYVTAEHPLGKWSDPVVLKQVEGIDPSFFFDSDGKGYIVYKSDEHSKFKWSNHRALSIIEFDVKTGTTKGNPVKFKEKGVGPEERLERDEGPHIYKIDNKYYLLAAEGGTNWVHSEVCYRSDSVFGPYERWSRNPMLTQRLLKTYRKLPVTSSGHVDMVKTSSGEWYAVFLGCRPWNNGEDHLGRETFLMPVKWSKDGFPYITQNIDTVSLRANRNRVQAIQQPVNAGNFTWSDDFKNTTLRPEWMSLWGTAEDYYSLGKGLELETVPINTKSGRTPAFLARRMQHHKFEAETELLFKPNKGEAAGILLFKNEYRQYMFAVMTDKIVLLQIGKQDKILACQPIPTTGEKIKMKVISLGNCYNFYYRLKEAGKWILLKENVPADYIATQRGGFTGCTIGLFATSALDL